MTIDGDLGVAMVTGIADLWIHVAVASHRDRVDRAHRRSSRHDG